MLNAARGKKIFNQGKSARHDIQSLIINNRGWRPEDNVLTSVKQ